MARLRYRALVLPLLALNCGPASAPALSAADSELLTEAIRGAEPAKKSVAACKALAEIERDRLPAFLITAMNDYSSLSLDQRAMVIAGHIDSSDGRSAWKAACPGGLEVLNELAMVAGEDRGPLLWEKCELSRFPLFDEEAVKVADSLGVILALIAANELTLRKSLSDGEAFAISQVIATPRSVIYEEEEAGL